MEIKDVFRNLVTNQYMDSFDYAGTEFSFKTVFHLDTLFSYCMCTCAFEHEFVDYITETGTIDEAKYEKIVKCIIDGECPHVCQVPEYSVKETAIYGIHIACAVGTIPAIQHNLDRASCETGKLYHTIPFSLTLLKAHQNDEVMALLRDTYVKIRTGINFLIAAKTNGNETSINFESEDFFDLLAVRSQFGILEYFVLKGLYVYYERGGETLFRLAVQYNLKHTHTDFIYRIKQRALSNEFLLLFHCQLWILYYDRQKWLETQITFLPEILTKEYLKKLNALCDIFKSVECQKVLSAHGWRDEQNLCSREQVKLLMDLLFREPTLLKETVDKALKQLPALSSSSNAVVEEGDIGNYLFSYNRSFDEIENSAVLKIILDNRINVDITDTYGVTPIIDLLQQFIRKSSLIMCSEDIKAIITFRQSVELYLFENIDVDLNQNAVELACDVDKLLNDADMESFLNNPYFRLTGLYHMDVNRHSVFGHDQANDFALNFVTPLFLESGFPMTNVSRDMTNDSNLHPDVEMYIHRFQATPRSLKASCRNSLRHYFKGRQIHKVVKKLVIPKSIEDFILLRPLLKAVPKHVLT